MRPRSGTMSGKRPRVVSSGEDIDEESKKNESRAVSEVQPFEVDVRVTRAIARMRRMDFPRAHSVELPPRRGYKGRAPSLHFTRSVARNEGRLLEEVHNIPLPPRRQPSEKERVSGETAKDAKTDKPSAGIHKEKAGKGSTADIQKEKAGKESTADIQKEKAGKGSTAGVQKGKAEEGSTAGVQKGKAEEGSTAGVQKGKAEEGSTAGVQKGKAEEGSTAGVQKGKAEEGGVVDKTDVERFEKYVQAARQLSDISTDSLVRLVASDSLNVENEVHVVETILSWMDSPIEKTSETVLSLFSRIRWNGINLPYLRKRLLENRRLAGDQAIQDFLQRVVDYRNGGPPYKGLITTHRASTGLERCCLVLGVCKETSASSRVMQLSLREEQASLGERVGVQMRRETSACVCPITNILYVCGIGKGVDEIWTFDENDGWQRCGAMRQGRRKHCAVFVQPSSVFSLAGTSASTLRHLRSVEKYDTCKNTSISAGDVIHAVDSAACVSHKGVLLMFGGQDEGDKSVGYIQLFDTTKCTCTLIEKCLPKPESYLRAVPWEHYVILLSFDHCWIFDMDKKDFRSRSRLKASRRHFGAFVENGRMFCVGGGTRIEDESSQYSHWELCDEVKSVSVEDAIQNASALWKMESYQLPEPSFVYAFGCVSCSSQ